MASPTSLPQPSGLFCFLNRERYCGPDCMAYISRPDGSDYVAQQWANCMLLVNAHRAGKHMVVIASTLGEQNAKAKTAAADLVRTNQPPPPVPR